MGRAEPRGDNETPRRPPQNNATITFELHEQTMADHAARLAVLEAHASRGGAPAWAPSGVSDKPGTRRMQASNRPNTTTDGKLVRQHIARTRRCRRHHRHCHGPEPENNGHRRYLQAHHNAKCTVATLNTRTNTVNYECCNEKTEDCSSGGATRVTVLLLCCLPY